MGFTTSSGRNLAVHGVMQDTCRHRRKTILMRGDRSQRGAELSLIAETMNFISKKKILQRKMFFEVFAFIYYCNSIVWMRTKIWMCTTAMVFLWPPNHSEIHMDKSRHQTCWCVLPHGTSVFKQCEPLEMFARYSGYLGYLGYSESIAKTSLRRGFKILTVHSECSPVMKRCKWGVYPRMNPVCVNDACAADSTAGFIILTDMTYKVALGDGKAQSCVRKLFLALVSIGANVSFMSQKFIDAKVWFCVIPISDLLLGSRLPRSFLWTN